MLVVYNWLVVAIVLKSSSIINRCDDRLHRYPVSHYHGRKYNY